jgi:prolyl oligopeptidase
VTAAARAAVFLSTLALLAAANDSAAPVRPVTDTYFGTAIVDPYRYMELRDPAYRQWTARQQQFTTAMLERARARYQTFVTTSSNIPKITDVTIAGNSVFYIRHDADDDVLMTCDARACHPRTVVESGAFGPSPSTSLGAFAASNDGRLVAIHVYVGQAVSDIDVLRVSDGRRIEAPIRNTVFDYVGFFADNRGIVYARPAGSVDNAFAGHFFDYAHRFGSPQASDVPVFGRGISKRVAIPERSFAFVDPHERFAIAEVRDFSAIGSRFYSAPIQTLGRPNTPWRLLGGSDAQYTDYAVHDTTIDLITHKNAPNYAVVRASLTGPFRPRIVLPPSHDTVISGTLDDIPKAGIFALNAARDGDYVQLLQNGRARMVRIPYDPAAKPSPFTLPVQAGSILAAAADPARDGLLLQMTSWTAPGDVYWTRSENIANVVVPLNILTKTEDAARIVSSLTATASDGTRIPVDVVSGYSAAAGAAPAIVISAGAFGFSITPDYRLIPQAWLDAGGIVAVAHIRGGGEFGENWHRAGMGAEKSNSWNDLIAAGQYLVQNHIASRLDLLGTVQSYLGGTASSVAIGRAIEERPDLFSAAVIDAPTFDMVRAETIPFGRQSIPEFGTAVNRAGFQALLAMSPYAHVLNGVDYPPILVRSFEHAYQIGADWQAAKMVARWQTATGRLDSAYLDIVQNTSEKPLRSATLRADALSFFAYENQRAPRP